MKRALALFAFVGAIVAGFAFHAEARKAGTENASCPPSKYADMTDAKTRDALRGKRLVVAFPEKAPEMNVIHGGTGAAIKVSRRDFLIYDDLTGKLNTKMMAGVICSSSCSGTAGAWCTNEGCEATSSGGCSAHRCFGGGCTDGGTCSKLSEIVEIEAPVIN